MLYYFIPAASHTIKAPMPVLDQRDTPARYALAADRVGMLGSMLCALHCALVPMLLALTPSLGLGAFAGADFDQMMAVFAGVLGVTSLSFGFRRHRAFRAWALLLPGLAMLGAGSFTSLHDHSGLHVGLMTLGGVCIALAHLLNLRLTHERTAAGFEREAA